MPSSLRPDAPDAPPFAQRAGSLLGAATLAAVVASLPAAFRAAPACGFVSAWLAIAACALVPAVVAVAILRGARDGLHAFAGPGAGVAAAGVALWALLSFAALVAWGALLRATTHHHALAGVTFAMGAVALGLAIALAVRRLVAIAQAAGPRARAAYVGVVFGGLVAAFAMGAVRLAASSRDPLLSAHDSALLVDALAFAIAAAFLSRGAFVRASWLARAGMPLALGTLLVGLAVLLQSPVVASSVREHAPLFAGVAELVVR
jgi:hypothetical protein